MGAGIRPNAWHHKIPGTLFGACWLGIVVLPRIPGQIFAVPAARAKTVLVSRQNDDTSQKRQKGARYFINTRWNHDANASQLGFEKPPSHKTKKNGTKQNNIKQNKAISANNDVLLKRI